MSRIGWIDFSVKDREKVRMVLDILKKAGVVDELGIGIIRDAFSDAMFPGISTIQTRAKYFFIVPYILKDYERIPLSKRVHNKADDYLKEEEIDCIKILVKRHQKDDIKGIIGIEANREGREIQRKPSSIYWTGLSHFKLIETSLSQNEFLKNFTKAEPVIDKRNLYSHSDDIEIGFEVLTESRVKVPFKKKWKDNLSIELDYKEADHLKQNILWNAKGSFLYEILLNQELIDEFEIMDNDNFSNVLLMTSYNSISSEMKSIIQAAVDFWNLLKGAHIRYNCLVQTKHCNGSDKFEDDWKKWFEEIQADKELKGRWLTEDLWGLADKTKHKVKSQTKKFVTEWIENIIQGKNDISIYNNLVRNQERFNKGKRSRLRSGAEKVKEGKNIGFTALNYRFTQAKKIVQDIAIGLNSKKNY